MTLVLLVYQSRLPICRCVGLLHLQATRAVPEHTSSNGAMWEKQAQLASVRASAYTVSTAAGLLSLCSSVRVGFIDRATHQQVGIVAVVDHCDFSKKPKATLQNPRLLPAEWFPAVNQPARTDA